MSGHPRREPNWRIEDYLNLNISTEELMNVAEIGQLLFYGAICTADDEDNADFFVGCRSPIMGLTVIRS